MFTNSIFTEPKKLNEAINAVLTAMQDERPGSKEYAALVDQLTKLYKLKEIDINLILKQYENDDKQRTAELNAEVIELDIEDKKRQMKLPLGLKPETVAIIAANLLGIGLILQHERLNVVASKAIGFVSKLKN